jgi:hypothetical protein
LQAEWPLRSTMEAHQPISPHITMEDVNMRGVMHHTITAPSAAQRGYVGGNSILSNRTDATKIQRSTFDS